MPNIPVRGVGGVGVISDLNPQDSPSIAWTDARNVRFAEGVLTRYSVFRQADPTYRYSKMPVGILNGWATGNGGLVTVFSDGTLTELQSGVVTDVTPTGLTLGTSVNQITTCTLGGLTYVNSEANVPIYRDQPSSGRFRPIPGWSSTDRCVSLRTFKDFLIAINVTKGGIEYSSMVKWSDAAQAGVPPSNWSVTDESSLAGENVINDISGPLIDGAPLSDSFMIYGNDQTFRMDFIDQPFIFRFQKVFEDQGVIAKNCVVEVDGRHYVFGRSDIYVHDGLNKQSIANTRVSKRIYSEIDFEMAERCFVYHDRVFGEIGFCYPSSDDTAPWGYLETQGCNRAAVFNYRFNTWTFVDLPSVNSSAEVQLVRGSTWEDFGSWESADQPWAAFAGTRPKHLILCSTGNPTIGKQAQSFFLDNLADGRLTQDIDPSLLWPAFATSEARDLDEIGMPLIGRKLVRRVVPQYRTRLENSSMRFSMGSSKDASGEVLWGREKTFLGYQSDRYDVRLSGRYLSVRVIIPPGSHIDFSGYDLEIELLSGR